VFVSVSCGPLLDLTLGTSGKAKQLLPEPLEQIQYMTNAFVLLRTGISEEASVHMDMEPAGRSLMGEISERADLLQCFFPRDFLQMCFERAGMGHKLQPVVQTSVRLDVPVFRVPVEHGEDLAGVAGILSAIVHFQLHAHI